MNDKLIKLNESLEKAEEKLVKIETTILKHFKTLDKRIENFSKFDKVSYEDINFNTVTLVEFLKQDSYIKFENLHKKYAHENTWELVYGITSKLQDIRNSHLKLNEANENINKLNKKINDILDTIKESENAPKVIIDFVNQWGEMALKWNLENLRNVNEDSIIKMIEDEKINKIKQLNYKVSNITGVITDASQLQISETGELVGFIIGEKGRAYLQTIIAGGWNIQCFHFRTLVQKV